MSLAIKDEPELTDVKTVNYEKKLMQCECSAEYFFTYNGKRQQMNFYYDVAYREGREGLEVRVAVDDVKKNLRILSIREDPIYNKLEEIFDKDTGKLIQRINWENGKKQGKTETFDPATGILIVESK